MLSLREPSRDGSEPRGVEPLRELLGEDIRTLRRAMEALWNGSCGGGAVNRRRRETHAELGESYTPVCSVL
jgi:hypothetical protein